MITQKRMNALADAFDVEAALFGFQGHARVEIRDDGGVGKFGFANVRFDGVMLGTTWRQSILLFRIESSNQGRSLDQCRESGIRLPHSTTLARIQ